MNMLAYLQGLINGHSLVVIVALFALISSMLAAIAQFLTATGKKVPAFIGSILNGIASIVHFLNGSKPQS